MPGALAYLWDWFLELSALRGATGFGLARISALDVAAHALLMRRWPEPWELRVIFDLDLCWLAARAPGDPDDGAPA